MTAPAADNPKRPKLGRGLSALLGDDDGLAGPLAGATGEADRGTKMVPVEFLKPNPGQPRKRFDDSAIDGLVDSIREKGVLQPILVRPHPDAANTYQIVAGERRWRAAQRAKLHEVPVVIKSLTDRDALEIALIENIHREDLTPLEEAEGYLRLMDEFDHTQEALATAIGKSRSHVANMLRLLTLSETVKCMLDDGLISAGHARAILGSANPEALADEIVAKGLNVRQAEKLAQAEKRGGATRSSARIARAVGKAAAAETHSDPDTRALERLISLQLGLTVTIEKASLDIDDESGRLCIQYTYLNQLDEILEMLSVET